MEYEKRQVAKCNEKWEAYIWNLVKIINVLFARLGGEKTEILSAPSEFLEFAAAVLALNAVMVTSTRPNVTQSYRRNNVTAEFQWTLGSK